MREGRASTVLSMREQERPCQLEESLEVRLMAFPRQQRSQVRILSGVAFASAWAFRCKKRCRERVRVLTLSTVGSTPLHNFATKACSFSELVSRSVITFLRSMSRLGKQSTGRRPLFRPLPDHRLVNVELDGEPVVAREHETVASLLASIVDPDLNRRSTVSSLPHAGAASIPAGRCILVGCGPLLLLLATQLVEAVHFSLDRFVQAAPQSEHAHG